MNLHSFTAIYSFTKGPFKNYEGKEKGETSFFSFLTQTDSPETHFRYFSLPVVFKPNPLS